MERFWFLIRLDCIWFAENSCFESVSVLNYFVVVGDEKIMFGLKKSPLKAGKQSSVEPAAYPVKSGSNPFDSFDEAPHKQTHNSSRRTSSQSGVVTPETNTNPFDDDLGNGYSSSSSYALGSAGRNKYKNDFRDTGGLENQSVQELENYAVYKAEETTAAVKGCLKIAEEIKDDATKTLVTLHQQGEQITRTHYVAADLDQDLSRGEKLLGSLGGMFSKTWKPKKTRVIAGPTITSDNPVRRKGNHLEQRDKLGLNSAPTERSKQLTLPPEPETAHAFQKVEVEKVKQDDALSDLSNILGELKDMAMDMGSEIDRQNKAMDDLYVDVDELNSRVRGANQRGLRLLRK